MSCLKCGDPTYSYIPICNTCTNNERKREMDNHIKEMKRLEALDEATAIAQENGEYEMSHKENDKLFDAVDDGTIDSDDERVSDLLEDQAATEEHKMKQLLTFFKWGFNNERIEDCDDGDFIPSIDPPELEKGLYIEPRMAEKIRRLLKEEIDYAKGLRN